MEELSLKDFSVQMYENSDVLFALLYVKLNEDRRPCDVTCVYCNDAYAKLSGFTSKEQFIGCSYYELFAADNMNWVSACYQAAYEMKPSEIKDISDELGRYLHMHIFPAGQPGYVATIVEDFSTFRQEYQAKIEKANHELRLTLDKEEQFRQATLSDSMIVANLNVTKNLIEDEVYERVNGKMIPLLFSLGMPCPCRMDAFFRAFCEKRVDPKDQERFLAFFSQKYLLAGFESGQMEHTIEYAVHSSKGEVYNTYNTTLLAKDPKTGDIIALCNVKDITAQRKQELEYRIQEEQQKQALTEALTMAQSANEAMNTIYSVLGAARWTLTYNEKGEIASFWWSDELRRMLGYAPEEEYPDRFDLLRKHMHPDDADGAAAALGGLISKLDSDPRCDIEFRLYNCKTGIYRWYRVVGKAVKKPDGSLGTFYGVLADIDERKQAELSARQEIDQTEKTYHMLHRLIKSGMWSMYYDEEGNRVRVDWSDEFRHMLGYEDENDFPNTLEAWVNLLHPDDRSSAYDTIEAAVFDKTGKTAYDVEYRLKTRDRGYRWFRATGDVYRRYDGSPFRFFGVFFDIDDQKYRDALEVEKSAALERAQIANQAMNTIHEALGSGNWSMEYNEAGQRVSVFWSEEFRKLLGFRNEEDFPNTFEAWFERLHPEDQARVGRAFDDTVADYSGNTTYDVEYRLLTKEKGYRWYRATGRLVRRADGSPITFYGLFVDIDDKKQDAIALEDTRKKQAKDLAMIHGLSHEYYALMMIRTKDLRMSLYRDTSSGSLNTALEMGQSKPYYESFMKNYIESFVVEEDRKRVAEETDIHVLREKISADGIYAVSYRRVNGNGESDYRQMVFSRVLSEDGEERWVLGFRDINELIEKERQQQKLLEDALEAAQNANKAKTVFLSNMSHDIRTPMNAIIGFTNLATAHLDNKEQVRDYLSKITVSSTHLLSLINDILDMSRIESGKVKMEENDVHLPDVLHDLKTIVQADIQAKQLSFFMNAVDVVNEDVVCDKLRLNQVLLNLLSNAMKFTKAGGIVSISVIQKDGAPYGYANYEFRVKDTGIGMSEEFLAHVFEPFERERNSTNSGIQGTGLGMAITKNIVDMMKGTIAVTSEVGKGTEFVVSVQMKIKETRIQYEPIPELLGKRVLVADDDYHTCVNVTRMLDTLGMRSDWTISGKEAIFRAQHAAEQNDAFGAMIVDWLMPDVTGVEIVREFRARYGEEIPIIIMTAYDWTSIEDEAKEAGVTSFLSKPLFMSKLREALTQPACKNAEIKEEENVDFTGKKILLVEDNVLNQEIAVEILTEAGFRVDTADDGEIAVAKMKQAVAGQYDLILMDVQMPRMDGNEATRQIRALENSEIANIPIIAMTANAFEEDKQCALQMGMNGFLAKPIDIVQLFETLATILG